MLLHALRRAVAWTIGLVLVAGTASALGVAVFPLATGGAALAVLSGSMTPDLPVGAMAFTRQVDPMDVRPGDVITFQPEPASPALVTHRVLAVDSIDGSPVFTTKGDANDAADLDPVPASAVRGALWFAVPHLGRASAMLHSPKGVGLLVILVCAVIAVTPEPRPGAGAGRTGGEPDGAGSSGLPGGPPADDAVDAADARTVVMPGLAARPPGESGRPARPPVPPPSRDRAQPALR